MPGGAVLSVTVRLAEAVAPPEVNLTEMVQLLPAASELDELGHVLVSVNVPEPVMPMLAMISGVVPVLVRVAVCVELLFLATVPKFMLAGVRVAVEYVALTLLVTCGAAV